MGGKDNHEVDRQLLAQVDAAVPEVRIIAVSNREHLIRAVQFLARDTDIDQFLDCGSGLPTAENTHQVAQRLLPDARVVYVDNDPVVRSHLDLTRPPALMVVATPHHHSADEGLAPAEVMRRPALRVVRRVQPLHRPGERVQPHRGACRPSSTAAASTAGSSAPARRSRRCWTASN